MDIYHPTFPFDANQSAGTNARTPIFLIGMMGSGKTTVGKLLSKALNIAFCDLDDVIENNCGADIPTIFALEGEAGFRKREQDALRQWVHSAQTKTMILATGGGTVLDKENQKILKTHGKVIYLYADVEELWERTKYDRHRPLLENQTEEQQKNTLNTIYQNRRSIYEKLADYILDTQHNNPYLAAEEIMHYLKSHP